MINWKRERCQKQPTGPEERWIVLPERADGPWGILFWPGICRSSKHSIRKSTFKPFWLYSSSRICVVRKSRRLFVWWDHILRAGWGGVFTAVKVSARRTDGTPVSSQHGEWIIPERIWEHHKVNVGTCNICSIVNNIFLTSTTPHMGNTITCDVLVVYRGQSELLHS